MNWKLEKKYLVDYKQSIFSDAVYQTYKDSFQRFGSSLNLKKDGFETKIYLPSIAVILTTSKLKVTEDQADYKKVIITIDGRELLSNYITGYLDGIKYFEENYTLSSDSLYEKIQKNSFKTLHEKYFHSGTDDKNPWITVKQIDPIIISNSIIEDHGFYSGLVHCTDLISEKHPDVYKKYFLSPCKKCEYPDYYSIDFSLESNLLIPKMPMKLVADHFIMLITNKSKVNGKPFLTKSQFRQFIYTAFLNNTEIDPIRLNVGPQEKGFIIKLFHQFYQKAKSYNSKFSRKEGIKLLTDYFSNWSFDEVKHNFNDHVVRKWHDLTISQQ